MKTPIETSHTPYNSARSKKVSTRASIGALLLISLLSPISAHSATYSAPAAPTHVTAYTSARGIVVRWTPSPDVAPAITSYIVSAGPGSCPVVVPASNHSVVTMPVLAGQTSISPVVQAVNAYGFSPVAKADRSFVTADLKNTALRSDLKSLQLLQLSDFHGAIETTSSNIGAPVLATAFTNDRAKNALTLTLSSGDNIGAAPPISTEFEEMPTIESLNAMKFDASTFGNHEHDRVISHLQKVIGASDFQWVVSNYSSIEALKSGTKATKNYAIIERDGVKVGIVGGNTEQTKEQVFSGNLSFTNAAGVKKEISIDAGVTGINAAIAAAKAAGAVVVIALLHQGWSENANGIAQGRLPDLAEQIKGAAVVFGGHSHLVYSSLISGTRKNPPVLIAEVQNSGQAYTRTQVCVAPNTGKVLGSSVEYITKAAMKNVAADATTSALVKKYKDQLSGKLDAKIGAVAAVFPSGGSPQIQRSAETALGDFTTDALRARYKTDLAFINGGGIRDTFPARAYTPADTKLNRPGISTTAPYDVTLGDALTVYPFGNVVAVSTITGANLWKALENGVSDYPSSGRFPQISGFRFTFDTSKVMGSRVQSVTKPDGTAIASDSTIYTVATNDFMLYGGDGYLNYFTPSTAKLTDLLLTVLVDSIKSDAAAGKVTQVPALDGRIKKVG